MLNQISSAKRFFWAIAGVLLVSLTTSRAVVDFTVTSPGVYAINGVQNDPAITLTRGKTYTFAIKPASIPPFIEKTNTSAGTSTAYNTGLSANNINNGTITWTVATNAPNTLHYVCSVHGFFGTITIVNPPAPPTVRVL